MPAPSQVSSTMKPVRMGRQLSTPSVALLKRMVLPVLPVYSNVYFDFYPHVLHEYEIAANISWPQAIITSYLSDYIPEEEAAAEEEPELQ